CQQHNSCPPTF
nr:immunoglobulin light chain junction region [Macaca mulatta]